MRWLSEPPWPPGERERVRALLPAREWDALRMARAGFGFTAIGHQIGVSDYVARSLVKSATARVEDDLVP